MQVRDMFLKNNKTISIIIIIIIFFFSKYSFSENLKNRDVVDYIEGLKFFSASFIQNDSETLSEGMVYIGEKRVRAEYLTPSKILIVLDEDKAMYYNYELEEDEFFNPKNTNAWFFYDIFRNPYFFEDGKIVLKDKEIILTKNGFDSEETKYLINVYFENSPIILRKIKVFINDTFLQISIFDHNYNVDFDKSFFKLISPELLN